MWARVVEFMIAVWLLLSPFIFHAQDLGWLLLLDTGFASLIVLLSALSFYRPCRFAYLGNLLVACTLVVIGRFSGDVPPEFYHQNHIFVGLFLFLMAIVPNHASQPPPAWR